MCLYAHVVCVCEGVFSCMRMRMHVCVPVYLCVRARVLVKSRGSVLDKRKVMTRGGDRDALAGWSAAHGAQEGGVALKKRYIPPPYLCVMGGL